MRKKPPIFEGGIVSGDFGDRRISSWRMEMEKGRPFALMVLTYRRSKRRLRFLREEHVSLLTFGRFRSVPVSGAPERKGHEHLAAARGATYFVSLITTWSASWLGVWREMGRRGRISRLGAVGDRGKTGGGLLGELVFAFCEAQMRRAATQTRKRATTLPRGDRLPVEAASLQGPWPVRQATAGL